MHHKHAYKPLHICLLFFSRSQYLYYVSLTKLVSNCVLDLMKINISCVLDLTKINIQLLSRFDKTEQSAVF